MKKLVLLIVLTFLFLNDYSQTANSTISIKNKKYYQNGQLLNTSTLKAILANIAVAEVEYQDWKKNSNLATPMVYAGTASVLAGTVLLLTYSIKQINDPYHEFSGLMMPLMLVGLVIDFGSLPISSVAKKHLNKAIDLYNSNLKDVGYHG